MKKVFYEKRGRRYYPVAEYDSNLMDSFPEGNHLVMCYPDGKSLRYNVDPNYAAMIAAGRVARDSICNAISKASEMKASRPPLTDGQIKAWKNLKKEFGDDLMGLKGVSLHDCVDAGMNAMMEEANKRMEHPEVKKAFEQFLLVARLAK
jgi:hypothetical protein